MKPFLLAAALLSAAPLIAAAQGMDHSAAGHRDAGHETPAAAAANASSAAFEQANRRMHEAMAVEPTGDADVDFARAMIPHHRGAIDMARIVIEHSDDPEMRALAQEIVDAQEAEIAVMEAWLAQNAAGPDAQ